MKTTIAPLLIALTLAACADAEPVACEPTPSTEATEATPAPAAAPATSETPATVAPSKGPKVVFDDEAPEKVKADAKEPTVDVDADLYVKRLVVAEDVKSREPVGEASTFEADAGRIYAFVEVGNRDRSASEIFVSFRREGEPERGRIPLRVGASPRWRTWAYTRLAKEPGQWDVIVRDARGEEIGRESFTVKAELTAPKTEPLI